MDIEVINKCLHVLRNPYSFTKNEIRKNNFFAADLIESQLEEEIKTLKLEIASFHNKYVFEKEEEK